MSLSINRKAFWHGLLHATYTTVYALFIGFVMTQIPMLFGGQIAVLIEMTFWVFTIILSVAVVGWLIFYEPVKYIFDKKYRAATVMLLSTLGWLFIFLIIFLLSLVLTLFT